MIIYNTNQKSKDYTNIKDIFRPGHADFTYFHKYGLRDYRGGGRSSARETAARVAAGAIAKKVLENKLGKKFYDYKIITISRNPENRLLSTYYMPDFHLHPSWFVRKINHFTKKKF